MTMEGTVAQSDKDNAEKQSLFIQNKLNAPKPISMEKIAVSENPLNIIIDSQIQKSNFEELKANRNNELDAVKKILTGHVSIIWIFIIGGGIEEDNKRRII
jgi:hypothetical protein